MEKPESLENPWRIGDIPLVISPGQGRVQLGLLRLGVVGVRAERGVKSKSIRKNTVKREKGPIFHSFLIKN